MLLNESVTVCNNVLLQRISTIHNSNPRKVTTTDILNGKLYDPAENVNYFQNSLQKGIIYY